MKSISERRFNKNLKKCGQKDFGSEDITGMTSEKVCQKLPPTSDRANASWVQDGSAAGQGSANQE